MERTIDTLSEKMTSLSQEQLGEVERFIESLRLRNRQPSARSSMALSEPAFELIWSNTEDDAYDAL